MISCTYNYIQLSRRDADLFGSQELPVPPACLITVWDEETDDTEELLSYSVGLKEIDSVSKEICITRFLETSRDKGNINYNIKSSHIISSDSIPNILDTMSHKTTQLIVDTAPCSSGMYI